MRLAQKRNMERISMLQVSGKSTEKRKENRYTAKNLPECALSKHIEDRVNSHIKAHDKTNEGMGQNLKAFKSCS